MNGTLRRRVRAATVQLVREHRTDPDATNALYLKAGALASSLGVRRRVVVEIVRELLGVE